MSRIGFTPDDVIDLADELRLAGYDIGTQQYVAAQDLLIALAAHGRLPEDPRSWRNLFAPIFCSSAAEQENFYQRFDQWLLRRPQMEIEGATPMGSHHVFERVRQKIDEKARWFDLRRRPKLLISCLVSLALIVAAFIYLSAKTTHTIAGKVISSVDGNPVAGAEVKFDPLEKSVRTDGEGKFSASYQVKNLDRLRRKASYTLSVLHPKHLPYSATIDNHPPDFQNITLTTPQEVQQSQTDSNVDDRLPQVEPARFGITWQRALVAALPLIIFALWWLWRFYRRRMLLQRLQIWGSPDIRRIPVKGAGEKLFRGQRFRRAIQELRRHRRLQSNELDVHSTINATIRRAGMFTPLFGSRRVLPEYLMLIDRVGAQDEQAKLGDEIYRRLDSNGVFVDRYYFQNDPRISRKPEPDSLTFNLSDLAAKHPDHCLMIFGDGAGLISPVTGEPENWIDSFEHWHNRAILTPEPAANWGDREAALSQNNFFILPATQDGLAALTETVVFADRAGFAFDPNGDQSSGPYPEVIANGPRRWLERHEPQPAMVNRLIDELKDYLGIDGWQWLSACAVYPAMAWDITLFLGYRLFGEGEGFEERLTRLVRLPWFRYGTMPDWFRACLIESQAPEQEQNVRESIRDLLLSMLDNPEGGLTLEVALAQRSKDRGLLARLKRWWDLLRLRDFIESEPEDSPLRDQVFLSFMSGRKPSKLNVDLPNILQRMFFSEGQSVLGVRPSTAFLIAAFLSSSVIGWVMIYKFDQVGDPPGIALNLPGVPAGATLLPSPTPVSSPVASTIKKKPPKVANGDFFSFTGTDYVEVFDVRASRDQSSTVQVAILARTPSSGWRVYTSHEVKGDVLRVKLKGEKLPGVPILGVLPNTTAGGGITYIDAPILKVEDPKRAIRAVQVQGSNGIRQVAVGFMPSYDTNAAQQALPAQQNAESNNPPLDVGQRILNQFEVLLYEYTAYVGLWVNRDLTLEAVARRKPTDDEMKFAQALVSLNNTFRQTTSSATPSRLPIEQSARQSLDNISSINNLRKSVKVPDGWDAKWAAAERAMRSHLSSLLPTGK